jgi:polyisoprenoid-binding protein YceI
MLIAAAVVAAPLHATDSYTIDPESSMPVFDVEHLGFTTQHGRFRKIAGKVILDRADRKGSVEFTVDTGSLDMGSTSWTAHLSDTGLFNVLKFPSMFFKSTRLVFSDDRITGVDGTLTMLGVSRPVHLIVQNFRCGEHPQSRKAVCGCDVAATLRRSDFGLGKYLESVSDEVHIQVPVLAYKD